jgi:hypothetical protein
MRTTTSGKNPSASKCPAVALHIASNSKGTPARGSAARGDAGSDTGRGHGQRARRQQRLTTRLREEDVEVEVTPLGDAAHARRHHGEGVGVFDEAHAQRPGKAGGGEVVVRRAQAAADDQKIGFGGERVLQRRRQPLLVVGHGEDAGHLDPAGAEVGTHESAVGVAGAPVEQFVAAEDDGGARQCVAHKATFLRRFAVQRDGLPGMRMTPRAFMK